MINERTIREWYTPVEIFALRNWLVAATVVNILLLTFDFLRGDDQLLILGVAGCVALAVLRVNLPESNNPNKRNISLFLCAIIISLGAYRLILMPYSIFNIWINLWLIAPGIISLFFL